MNEENKNALQPEPVKEDSSSNTVETKREKRGVLPEIHLTNRAGVTLREAFLVRVIAIAAALVLCAIITVIFTRDNPFKIYATIVRGAFGKGRGWVTIHSMAILLCVSLAVTPAFRMHFWNIGAEGQVLIGGLATAYVMFKWHESVSTPVLVILMLAAALIAGAIWGLIPAIFKAQWKTNETLFTLMMNYVAMKLIEFFLKIADKSGSNVVDSRLLGNGVPDLFGVQYLLNVVIVVFLVGLLYVYLRYSKHGYEISVVGESENTARYIGINVKKVIIRTLVFSGLLCGVSGFLLVSGTDHSITTGLDRGYGFTAIIVAWLAKFNPLMMVLTSFLIVFLDKGASDIATGMRLNESMGDIITGIIIFFIIGCEFFINYRIAKTRREG